MFANVVLNLEHNKFEEILEREKKSAEIKLDCDLTETSLEKIIKEYKELIEKETKKPFPENPKEQLLLSVKSVFNSWNNKRAITYRKLNKIPDSWGTAVIIQEMVFGNLGNTSGTGVCFTRNPSTGIKELFGEFLLNAQGEDVVAGIRTPKKISELKNAMPELYEEFFSVCNKLEQHYKEMQDLEFTIENNKLFILQTRTGKRTASAAVRIAVEMTEEGVISKEDALLRINPLDLNQLLHKRIDPNQKLESIAQGLNASPGAALGKVFFDADSAEKESEKGNVILVRNETSPDDIHGMAAAKGILTAKGGSTCIGKDSLLLTNKGFFSAVELFGLIEHNQKIKILSFDSKSMKAVWKDIIAAGKRKAKAIEINVSQSGRTKENTLAITPNHKMMLINNRKLEKKPLENVLADQQMVSVVDRMPFHGKINDPNYSYLAGAIFTDGCLQLSKRRGKVTFTQKKTYEKIDFIRKVNRIFFEKFGLQMKEQVKNSVSNFEGRTITSSCFDYVCSRKLPVETLLRTRQSVVQWVLSLDEQSTLSFLAGAIDGDGSFSNGRLQIYVGREELLMGVTVACLKLGIVPQVTQNRTIANVQIVEKIDEICRFTARVRPETAPKKYESKLFSTRQLFNDVKAHVDFTGRIKPAIKENKMLGAGKITDYVLKYKRLDDKLKTEINNILDSDLRMYRAKKTANLGIIDVYNFEIKSNNELDKNFVVFTKKYTPLLVSNSHAAVVARGMGKPCVTGCEEIRIDYSSKTMKIKNHTIHKGDFISIDGSTGKVFLGEIKLIEPEPDKFFSTILEWSDSIRKLGVRTNADTPKDALKARELGAEGIGLCRTEHMFFQPERLPIMQKMILSSSFEERKKFLDELEKMQREDFEGILEAMKGFPVTIRLIDPPLHEFLPSKEKLIEEVAELKYKVDSRDDSKLIAELSEKKSLLSKVNELHESNPMLGFRGCRLGIVYPEIIEMQSKAIAEATLNLKKKGIDARPEIMIPLVGIAKELEISRKIVAKILEEILPKNSIPIGTMIELPRAALTAEEISSHADFFSFGTNDLTQTTFGFSRDDIEGKFMGKYLEQKILLISPFVSLDVLGVGKLMQLAVKLGKKTNPKLKLGICGEHGGDPESIEFCHSLELDYVSCSPFRVPIARLAAAQATIKSRNH